MSLYVVDANIAIKLYVPEVHSAEAVRFYSDEHELIAPEFMLAEVTNIVWKKATLLGEISESEAQTIVAAVQELPFDYYYTAGLLNDALKVAMQTKHSVYDSLYLALAWQEGCQLMTDDRKLYQSLHSTSLATLVTLIENS
jgi:predicted nucleic acid-binding protein